MSTNLHFFGIRHHGPGCARSLVRAFDVLRPDCVLIEGPPEGESLMQSVVAEGMRPPVALLSYCPDEPRLAVYHPFAEFSPEWQALCWAVSSGAEVRFIDLPQVHGLALDKTLRDADQPVAPSSATDPDARQAASAEVPETDDPLNWLAQAAGYADGESWWNHMVEERGDGQELFAAIAEVMITLREEVGDQHRPSAMAT